MKTDKHVFGIRTFLAIVRPCDDDKIVEVYDVRLRNGAHCTKNQFERAWGLSRTEVSLIKPGAWDINDIISAMHARGWMIENRETIAEVFY